ncbi:LysR substrate-binding domain-containing protein [Photobacterium sp. Hal280]
MACALVASGLGITIVNSVLLSGVRQDGLSARPVNGLPNYAYGLITKHGRKHTPIIDVVTEEIQSELIEKFQ